MKPVSIALLLALSAPAYAVPTITVSKTTQTYTVEDNGVVVKTGRVSTGKRGYATPSGTFVIHTKVRRTKSMKYRVWMNDVMLFRGSKYALHRGVVPGYPASHGCVRLPSADATYLFSTLPIGTKVIVR